MNDAAFIVCAPTGKETPVIVEIPHAGLAVPPFVMPELLAPVRAMGRDADLYVDELYDEAPARGATVLLACTSRYVVDLNRDESDVDSQSVASGAAGASAHSPRGVIWRITTEGDRTLAAPLRREAFEERLREVYRPYHAKLTELIRLKKERFGLAVVLAAHSMPSQGGTSRGTERADVVPGTQGRTSADARFIDGVEAHARESNLSICHDDPYKGGFTTRHYGRPQGGVHVVQVELARRLYMDEVTLRRRPGRFERMQAWCGELVAKLGHAALT
jgi:N-formylglutamate deformylase